MYGGSNTIQKHWRLKTAPITIQSMCPVPLGMALHHLFAYHTNTCHIQNNFQTNKKLQLPIYIIKYRGHAAVQLFEALRYKSEGRGFESHRGHGYLSVVSVVCCQVEVSATS